MKKIRIFAVLFLMALLSSGMLSLLRDQQMLEKSLIRLHVVANSDSEQDQEHKLQVKDAVRAYLKPAMGRMNSREQALAYLEDHISEIQRTAEASLRSSGDSASVTVSLQKEAFGKRVYDTFSLPSGIYESLRIRLGKGKGHNWWCVVYPSLCEPSEQGAFEARAVSAGLNQELTDTLTESEGYEVRFFFLDLLGKLRNLWR